MALDFIEKGGAFFPQEHFDTLRTSGVGFRNEVSTTVEVTDERFFIPMRNHPALAFANRAPLEVDRNENLLLAPVDHFLWIEYCNNSDVTVEALFLDKHRDFLS